MERASAWAVPMRARVELQVLVELGGPLIVAVMSSVGLSLTELAVAGHLGTPEYTAVAFAQLVLDFTLVVFAQGFNKGLVALAAQAYGAHNHELIGQYTQLTAVGLTLLCAPIGLLWYSCCGLLGAAGVSARSVELAALYARASITGLWPRLMFDALAASFQAQQLAAPAAVASAVAVAGNAFLSVLLAFGLPAAGVPGLGLLGCAVAMVLTQYARLGGYLWHMHRTHATMALWHWRRPSHRHLRALVVVGAPLMLGELFENLQFQTMAVFAALLGETALAAHNTTLQVVFFFSSPIYGLHDAGVSRIGMYLGAGHADAAAYVSRVVLAAAVGTSVVVAGPWILARYAIGAIFSRDAEVGALIASVTLLAATGYIALSLFFYAMATLSAQARAVPIMTSFVCGAWFVGVPAAYVLSQWQGMGLLGIWSGMALGYAITTAIGVYYAGLSDWPKEAAKAVARSQTASVPEATPLLL
ncbi:Multidrug/Oligosaccharidyl-lipid/Polysaccharide (MOP) Flippase Superfamily [Achlya hypogyna]|uniref:Multidrug/Oligosaccharidyl-lipid/Polysaccharide (MOP) Flippase Superfamily n=1 Tax=Achlya hypogyna TaxID=1202772 RepID=A0A1V9YRD1_ACHHY|nr:Multidrug/Oligosaccharidyl-lipid/Polysaccharide (MOP) Flippase Superfamily [Achlya hypogyna]